MTGADLSPQLQHGFQRQRLITARAFFRGASFVDVEATSAHRTEENDATKMMIDRVEERFDLKPECLIGDTAYGTAAITLNAQRRRCTSAIFDGTDNATNTAVRRGMRCAAIGASSRTRARTLPKKTRLFISPGNPNARLVQ